MNNFLIKMVIGSMVVSLYSCTGNYLDINSNPYQIGDLTADDYALGSAMNNLAGCVISPDVNTAQFTDCVLGGPMGGYFADSKSEWKNTISMYNAKDDWTRVFLKSDRVIPILYTNLTSVELLSEKLNNKVPVAIANIIKVASMSRVTDTYGAIPYSKIGKDGSITTPYDSQEDIYKKFFEELDAAIEVIKENPDFSLSKTSDYVYGGDLTKWIKFANSMKLRLAMRISYANYDLAKQMAEEAVAGGVIEDNQDNAKWDYFKTNVNPIYTATRYNQATGSLTGGDTHAAADIICYMNGYKDPRREKFFVKSEWDGDNFEFVGLRRGIIVPGTDITRKYSGVNIKTTDPLYWMNAAEVWFLRAEGKAVFDFDMRVDAKTAYETGIRRSFEQWGVEGVDDYLIDNQSVPTTYTDPAGKYNFNTPLSYIKIQWDDLSTKEEKQERIIIQKWIANWMLGNEAWADFRRTGYPKLIPASEDGNQSNGIVDSEKGARRMPYPLDEYISNTENVEYAVSNYLKGPDNMSTRVWWDCK